jgi:hypothetical protein
MISTITSSIKDSKMLIEKENIAENAKIIKGPIINEHDQAEKLNFQANYILTKFPDLPTKISLEYWKDLRFGFRKGDANLTIESIPVAEGKTSYAFKIYDQTRKMNLIGKIDKDVYNGDY